MDLTYPPEAESYRAEVRAWLEVNLPAAWGEPGFSQTQEEKAAFSKEWTGRLRDGGWICASWPAEYGGKGLSLIQQVVVNEEFARVNAPMRADFFGDTLVGPTILQWGTEEQKKGFLPKILSGEITWCQGFSEPDAGSDLAGVKTRAVLDGDEWVINGQKIWTTQAQHADYMFLLARTDPDAPKHKGISYLLVPMRQSGIEVRPIEQIDSGAEFNEVFFTDARCPATNVVGGVNNGWTVAMTTLGFERGTSATTGHRRFVKELDRIIDIARRNGKATDPLIRQRLASAWGRVKIMQVHGYRSLTSALHGDHSAVALSATNKMYWSEYHRDVMELAIDILGMEGQILTGGKPGGGAKGAGGGAGGAGGGGAGGGGAGGANLDSPDIDEEFIPGIGRRSTLRDYPASFLQTLFFFSRSETIWGGTAQIQRNIVAERVLGMPKEPKPPESATAATGAAKG